MADFIEAVQKLVSWESTMKVLEHYVDGQWYQCSDHSDSWVLRGVELSFICLIVRIEACENVLSTFKHVVFRQLSR